LVYYYEKFISQQISYYWWSPWLTWSFAFPGISAAAEAFWALRKRYAICMELSGLWENGIL